jgi:hypothetical protein
MTGYRRPRLFRCAVVCDVPALFLSRRTRAITLTSSKGSRGALIEGPTFRAGLTGFRLPMRIRGTRHQIV